tara:strand:+ start:221 stop:484 length:264 start_codon:yes stop_codon:yes gene_type:complete
MLNCLPEIPSSCARRKRHEYRSTRDLCNVNMTIFDPVVLLVVVLAVVVFTIEFVASVFEGVPSVVIGVLGVFDDDVSYIFFLFIVIL